MTKNERFVLLDSVRELNECMLNYKMDIDVSRSIAHVAGALQHLVNEFDYYLEKLKRNEEKENKND